MSSHENHTVILLAVMMIVASTTAVMMISDQSEAALGTYEGGINSSSESNPYTGIDFQFSYSGPGFLNNIYVLYSGPGFLNNIYVLEGSYVSIDGEIDSVNNYMVGFSSVTSGYGLSLTRHTTDGTVPNDIISGTLSRSGTITIEATIATSFGVNNNTYTIYVVPTTSVLQITSTGGTEATVGYEYRYDVQTTPSNAIISISGVDWLSVSGHTISGTPDQSGDYVLTVTANLQGYTATDETVRIHVSEEQISQDVPTLGRSTIR